MTTNDQRDQRVEGHQVNSSETHSDVGQIGDNIETGGGAYIRGDVVADGDFVGRDKYIYGLTTKEVAVLVAELKRVDQPAVWDGRIPYLGLRPFREDDAKFFFGRERLVKKLLRQVKEGADFMVIAGPSGSGKSSLARAGLLHALHKGDLEECPEGSETWPLAMMVPHDHPIEQLAQTMGAVLMNPDVEEKIRDRPSLLPKYMQYALQGDPRRRFVLLVDQFEELFTQTKEEVWRAAFVDLLAATAMAEKSRALIILCLRSDFVSHCARFPALRDLMSGQFQLVGAMTSAELVQAITLPALEVGAEIDAALVSRIIDDMKGEPGALPLMSFALRDLFQVEQEGVGKAMDLTLQEYEDLGGIESALQRHADIVFGQFAGQQGLLRTIFSRLIEVGPEGVATSRRVALPALIPAGVGEGQVAEVIHTLAGEEVRLLITYLRQKPGTKTDGEEDDVVAPGGETGHEGRDLLAAANSAQVMVSLAHEKLIDAWPWLRQLVKDNWEMIALQNEISRDARAWEQAERDAGFLYREGRLLQVEERVNDLQPDLDELTQRFLDAGIAQRQREIKEEKARQEREIAHERALAEEQRKRADDAEEAAARIRRRRNVALGLAGGALLAALIAVLFYLQAESQRARADANAALAQTRQALAETRQNQAEASRLANLAQQALRSGASEPATALLLSVESLRVLSTSPEAQHAFLDTVPRTEGTWPSIVGDLNWVEPGTFAVSAGGEKMLVAAGGCHSGTGVATSIDGWVLGEHLEIDGETARVTAPQGVNMRSEPSLEALRRSGLSFNSFLYVVEERNGWYRVSVQYDYHGWIDKSYLEISGESARVTTEGGSLYRRPLTPEFLGGDSPLDRTLHPSDSFLTVLPVGIEVDVTGPPDSSYYPVYVPPPPRFECVEGEVVMWELEAMGPLSQTLVGHADNVIQMALNAQSDTLVSIAGDNTVLAWQNLDTDQTISHTLDFGNAIHNSVSSIAFGPRGQDLFLGTTTGLYYLESVNDTESRPIVLDRGADVRSLALSTDGDWLASGNQRGQITLRSLPAADEAIRQRSQHDGAVVGMVMHPDYPLLLSASEGGTVILWNRCDDSSLALDAGSELTDLALSSDGALLVAGTLHGSIILWRVEVDTTLCRAALQPLGTLPGHSAPGDRVIGLDFTATQISLLAVARADGAVELWQLDVPTWIEIGCQLAGRNLTYLEWQEAFPYQDLTDYQKTCIDSPVHPTVLLAMIGHAESQYNIDSTMAEDAYRVAADWASEIAEANVHTALCRSGALHGAAEIVAESCNLAVALAPEGGQAHDSRGIMLAISGDVEAALDDLRVALERDSSENDTWREMRLEWVEALEAGRNPFDDVALLEQLRND